MDTTLISAIASSGNLLAVVLVAIIGVLFSLLREQGKERREDQRELVRTLQTYTEVITQLRLELAQRRTGGSR